MLSIKEKEKKAYNELKTQFGYKNILASPRIVKVVVSSGIGSKIKKNPKVGEFISDRLAKITGQHPAVRGAKKSIAGFKIREGDELGRVVSLRGSKMYAFLDKFFNIALPRTKDFRGIPKRAVDEMGNFTISVREHTIFPETSDEDLKDVFGFAITIVTTAKSREEALLFFEAIGVPFSKK